MSNVLKVSRMLTKDVSKSPAWEALTEHIRICTSTPLSGYLEQPDRFKNFHLRHEGLIYDFSRQRISSHTLKLLLDLAHQQDVEGWRTRMFEGDKINTTETRPVLHTACRRPSGDSVLVDGQNVMPFIEEVRQKMKVFSDAVHAGKIRGATGERLSTIVNIGIGGSDLGPHMVCEALKPFQKKGIETHFVSNVDPVHISDVLQKINPEQTLFLVASKTFTTQETMANARAAKAWLVRVLGDEGAVKHHFVALSTNREAVRDFGINPKYMFPFESWVGGRFSLWSSIGLSISLSLGYDNFEKLLSGAYAMDRHFCESPLEQNIPVLMALIGIWNRNFLKYSTLAVLPYSQYLHRLPAFLQQLDMESNGKKCTRTGELVNYETGPVVFGEPGTNGQHAFYQLLHQGTDIIPADFIGIKKTTCSLKDQHRALLANMLAQAEALARGRTLDEVGGNNQRTFEGNRPSNILLFSDLSPYALGQLIALYEHKIFVQGIIWGINSFDQFGVELGKEMANSLLDKSLTEESKPGLFVSLF